MTKHLWGPGIWRFMHTVAFNYPEMAGKDVKFQTRRFYTAVNRCLMFAKLANACYLQELAEAAFESSETLFAAVIEYHDLINAKLKKPVYKKTFIQIAKMYFYSQRSVFWGPGLWHFLHTIAARYNGDNPMFKQAVMELMESLQYTIPCDKCKTHYIENISTMTNAHLEDEYTLSLYMYNLHNIVNEEKGKKLFIKPLDQVMKMYGHEF